MVAAGVMPGDTVLRILGIGDSITWGYFSSDDQGYFTSLDNNLGVRVSGCPTNDYKFIGTQTSGRFRNEGYSGLRVDQIQERVTSSGIFKQRPNVILLMAGTKDINQGRDWLTTTSNMVKLINYLFQECPYATIIVQHIPMIGYNDFSRSMTTLQKEVIKQLPRQRISRHQSARNNHTTFEHASGDGLHPNDEGYNRIGEAFTERIWVADQNAWIKEPAAVSSDPEKEACASGLWWDPQGEVASGGGLGKHQYPGITCKDYPPDTSQCSCFDDSVVDDIGRQEDKSGPSCTDMSYPNATAVHFADLNGDGRAEYLWVGPKGEVKAYYNNGYSGNGSQAITDWRPAGVIATGIGGLRDEIRFADLNGDGRADYLWVKPDGAIEAYLNGGHIAGSATPANIQWLPQGTIAAGIGKNGAGVRLANIAGVGRADYVWVDDVGALTGYLNTGPKNGNGGDAGQVGWSPQGTIATGIGMKRWNLQFGDIGKNIPSKRLPSN
ncbi:carbohydrate esterase family 3 protein [Cadophora sp. DSE1049]|nr:carbohydrate esterase family 3 protein [Cadophora sp. DSE1049]